MRPNFLHIRNREPYQGDPAPILMTWRDDPRPRWLVQLRFERARTSAPPGMEAMAASLESGLSASGMAGGAAVTAVADVVRVEVVVKESDERLAVEVARLVTASSHGPEGRLLGPLLSSNASPLEVGPVVGPAGPER